MWHPGISSERFALTPSCSTRLTSLKIPQPHLGTGTPHRAPHPWLLPHHPKNLLNRATDVQETLPTQTSRMSWCPLQSPSAAFLKSVANLHNKHEL